MDKKLNKIAHNMIDDVSHSLDSETKSKLNQARQKALMPKKRYFNKLSMWGIPATVVASLLVYLILPLNDQVLRKADISQADNYAVIKEMDIIDQFELVENLEFYQWLNADDESSI